MSNKMVIAQRLAGRLSACGKWLPWYHFSLFLFPPLYLFASHIELSFSLTMSFLTFALLIPYSIPLRVWVIMWMLSCWLGVNLQQHLDDLEEWVYKIQQMLPWTSWLLKKFDWGGVNTTLKCKICSVSLL